MNKDIVLIPAWNRPEFLAVTLENIIAAEGSENLAYVFLYDKGFDKELHHVVNQFPYEKAIHERKKSVQGIGKQSMNLLEGYRFAANHPCEYVFMIEDDIFIANDFFKWHYEVQRQNELFCSIATENNNSKFTVTDSLENYYFGHEADYQSLGVCFKRDVLKKHIEPHCTTRYYMNPVGYCRRFSNSIIGKYFAEQDGLIRRIRETIPNLPVAFPDVGRAYHAGFIGKNRNPKKKLTGTLAQRIDYVKAHALTHEGMKSVVEKPEYFEDSKPIPLTGNKWEKLIKQDHKRL